MLITKQHPLEAFHQRLSTLELKVEELLEHGDVTDEALSDLKVRLSEQSGMLHVLIRQGRATTRTQWYLWGGACVMVILLFLIVLRI